MSKMSQPGRRQGASLMLTTLMSTFVAFNGPNGPLYIVESQVVAVARAEGVGACETVIFTTASNPLYVCDSPEHVIEQLEHKAQTEEM
jgi:hypothetical protein